MKITGVIKYFYSVYVLGSLFLILIRTVPIYLYRSFTAFHLVPATVAAFHLFWGQLFCCLLEEAFDLCCLTMSQLFSLHSHF